MKINQLAVRRIKKGYKTPRVLAETLDLNHRTIENLEAGKILKPHLNTTVRICDALDISFTQFFKYIKQAEDTRTESDNESSDTAP